MWSNDWTIAHPAHRIRLILNILLLALCWSPPTPTNKVCSGMHYAVCCFSFSVHLTQFKMIHSHLIHCNIKILINSCWYISSLQRVNTEASHVLMAVMFRHVQVLEQRICTNQHLFLHSDYLQLIHGAVNICKQRKAQLRRRRRH